MLSTAEAEVQKLVEVARMYYERNMTQAEIAAKLGVSRPLVGKLLEKAREMGIVNIEIKDQQGRRPLHRAGKDLAHGFCRERDPAKVAVAA